LYAQKGSKINVDGIKAALGLNNHERYSSQCIILNLYTNSQSMVHDRQFNINNSSWVKNVLIKHRSVTPSSVS